MYITTAEVRRAKEIILVIIDRIRSIVNVSDLFEGELFPGLYEDYQLFYTKWKILH
jgi:hypothetical protein